MSSAKWWQFCLGFNVLICWMSRQYWILQAQCCIALILITFPHSLLIKWVVLILPGYINQLHAVFILEDIIVHLPYHLLMQFRFYCCLYDRRGKGNSSHAINFTLMKYSNTICLHFNDTNDTPSTLSKNMFIDIFPISFINLIFPKPFHYQMMISIHFLGWSFFPVVVFQWAVLCCNHQIKKIAWWVGVNGSFRTLSDIPVNKVHVTLGPISLMVTELINEMLWKNDFNHYAYDAIGSQFDTCHDSWAVMACAKLWPDHCSSCKKQYLSFQIFRLWAHISFVK